MNPPGPNLDVMFATTGGNVRRNKLSDFVDVRRSGIIAMKLEDDEAIVDVQICTERDDVLLTAAGGQCIRFPVTDVRVFTGRTSMGVRGIALAKGDKLISLVDPAPRRGRRRRARGLSADAPTRCGAAAPRRRPASRQPRRRPARSSSASSAMSRCRRSEQFVLTISRERLRQAHLVVRVPHHRPRRQRHRRDVGQRPQRQAGGLIPGRG